MIQPDQSVSFSENGDDLFLGNRLSEQILDENLLEVHSHTSNKKTREDRINAKDIIPVVLHYL